jgi:soluble lytic murein transglycosylase
LGAPLAVLLLLAQSAAGAASWRIAAEPRDAGEAAVREAATSDDPAAALEATAARLAGSPAGGLARIACGLALVDAGRPEDALAQLTHPDVDKTLLRDHALLGASRAHEALARFDLAGDVALAAAREPGSAVACLALPKAAELYARARRDDDALASLEAAAAECPAVAPASLLEIGARRLARGERAAAAAAFDRLDRAHPLTPEAKLARARLASLAGALPAVAPAERAARLLDRGSTLLAAGRTSEAIESLRAVPAASLPADAADRLRLELGRALISRGRRAEGRALLLKIPAGSPHAAEAAYRLAADDARRRQRPEPYVAVADRFAGSRWGEEALLSLANYYQKDALDESAAPWWRRLLSEYPDGRYVERAAWRAGWADYRASRFERAALTFEAAATRRPEGSATPGLLYWSGRARLALGQSDLARDRFAEAVRRYKHSYHGVRAQDALGRLGGAPPAPPSLVSEGAPYEPALPEPGASRARQLLLVERLDAAATELSRLPQTQRVLATAAWVDWRRGRLRPAITAMKRAFPEWVGEAGDRLPREVWQVMFPLRYDAQLVAAAREDGLDPALVAALILQESSYDPEAQSRAGARGLMQVMPATGRTIARAKGVRFKRAALHDPETSLDFGTHYLRQMSERFSGDVEKVLAAYNAGPHRVDAWTAARGPQTAEEFIESIPFTETRGYVMIVLANREQYRRLYGLARTAPAPVVQGRKP